MYIKLQFHMLGGAVDGLEKEFALEILKRPGVLSFTSEEESGDLLSKEDEAKIKSSVTEGVVQLCAMREAEGGELKIQLINLIGLLEDNLLKISSIVDGNVDKRRALLTARLDKN